MGGVDVHVAWSQSFEWMLLYIYEWEAIDGMYATRNLDQSVCRL